MTPRAVRRILDRPVEGSLPRMSGLNKRLSWGAWSMSIDSCIDMMQWRVASISWMDLNYQSVKNIKDGSPAIPRFLALLPAFQ